MNDDDVLLTNVVDSSSSKDDETVGSGSLEIAPLKGNVKPLALGGKGRQTSYSWNHFTKYQEDGRIRARCKYCPKNYACDSNTNGTTNMNKHLEKCKNYRAKLALVDPKQKCLVKQAPITSYTTSSREGCGSSIGLGIFNKEDTRKALIEMLIVDELPFRFVEKRGFRKFCRVGMPRFDVPSRRTIVRDILQKYIDMKKSLMKYFKESKVRVCLTTDTWTSIQNINYMVVIAHFIDDQWHLQKRILSFTQITDHRGETIGMCIKQVLLDWGIDRIFTITVDNATANTTAILYVQRKLKSWNVDGLILDGKHLHLRCCAHIVNLIVSDGLKEMHDSVVAIRNAVKFVKSSPSRFQKFKKYVEREKIQNKGLVVLDVPTRWNSTYLMLASSLKFVKAFDRMDDDDENYQNYFKPVENEPKRIGPPNFEHWENAKVFVQFLKTFYDVTLQFSATLSVTSNLYFHKWGTINNQLISMSGDRNHLVCKMASTMKLKFEKYWGSLENTNRLLIIAVVLDPMYKLQYVSYYFAILYGAGSRDSMTANIKDALVELYDSYNALYGGSGGSTSDGGHVDEIPLACGGEIDDSSIFDLSVAFSQTIEKQDNIRGTNEVERYLLEPVERKRPNFDVLTWWKVNSAHYPILALIAKDVFAMPIFTVASESAFSGGGRVLDSFWSSLNPKMVECLICTQNWLQATYRTNQLEEAIMNAQNDDASLENLQFNEDAEAELAKLTNELRRVTSFDMGEEIVSSQAAALHAVACGSVVITMLDKPTVHAVEV
ncbi:hypothetical protein EZV62_015011 [Acer yangbiense]|uniref:BED-type domain-containing protein n=1 Tax=Acer yangbiense TaxID=1000413 RepID=A0A5C7HUB0_9ROSI|nr:hypothetical protein EZV62_015011 [Acer yangbiense]